MNILFYTPLNTRCRDIESQAMEFKKQGHSIFLMTQNAYHILHENFESYGYKVESERFSSRFPYLTLLKRLIAFVSYCWKNRIDVVYSHLEPANFIAVLAQSFVRARIIVCRHHMDYAKLAGFDNDVSYKFTYRHANDIVVVSNQAKEYMVHVEGIGRERIHQINLAYNFDLYGAPNLARVNEIKSQFRTDILLLTICRLDKHKRPELSIELAKRLIDAGLDVRLLILGQGELYYALIKKVNNLGIEDRVFFTGHVENVLDHMKAADFLVHPSMSESSCISLKEAGIVALPAIVCKDVGDFEEVIQDRWNGFLVDKNLFVESSFFIIQDYLTNKEDYRLIGENLRTTVHEKFEIQRIAPYYERTFHQLK